MIFSMTGFGSANRTVGEAEITVEVRSVNSRFLDVNARLPKFFSARESELKEVVKQHLTRGKVMIAVSVDEPLASQRALTIDEEAVDLYARLLRSAAKKAGIDGPLKIEDLMFFRDIFISEENDSDRDELWKRVVETIGAALESLMDMRKKEGDAIRRDLDTRRNNLAKSLGSISKLAKNNVEEEFQKLKDRIQTFVDQVDLDEGRLELEMAVIADKIDISEELTRFESHLDLFERAVKSDQSDVGRKLNFILQEMNREANTISSKSTNVDIIHCVVSMKEEIEKMREQIQNVE